eukprot:TRINITY_DN6221_c0_g1_i1.p1 TRINITY_DN6221_c0_g1~~TRINITY_DN6221_c0_g1_i1.p1  ORF type:complete len:338 (+),score=33.89 TRINITY_DN6221_c0_g1_i1:22-1014(+)
MFANYCCASRKRSGFAGSNFADPATPPMGAITGTIFIGGNQSSGKTSTCHSAMEKYFPYAKYYSQDDRYSPDGTPNSHYSKEDRHHRLAVFARKWAEQERGLVFVDQVDYTHIHTDDASLVLTGAQFPVQSILLYLHLRDYPKRIARRTAEGDPRELAVALKQYAIFFTGVPERPANGGLEHITRGDLDEVFTSLSHGPLTASSDSSPNRLRQLLEASLHLDDNDAVWVVPRHSWDYVIDTSVNTTPDAAVLLRDRVVAAAKGDVGPSVLLKPTPPDPVALAYYSNCNRCHKKSGGACAECLNQARAYFSKLTGSKVKGEDLATKFYRLH